MDFHQSSPSAKLQVTGEGEELSFTMSMLNLKNPNMFQESDTESEESSSSTPGDVTVIEKVSALETVDSQKINNEKSSAVAGKRTTRSGRTIKTPRRYWEGNESNPNDTSNNVKNPRKKEAKKDVVVKTGSKQKSGSSDITVSSTKKKVEGDDYLLKQTDDSAAYVCPSCTRSYKNRSSLYKHQKYECGKEAQFHCPYCEYKAKRKGNLYRHISIKH